MHITIITKANILSLYPHNIIKLRG